MGSCCVTQEEHSNAAPPNVKMPLKSKSSPSFAEAKNVSTPSTSASDADTGTNAQVQTNNNADHLPPSFCHIAFDIASACNLEECGALSRLQHILSKQDDDIAKHGAFDFINHQLGKYYSNARLLDDHHHLMHVHEHEFEAIYNKLTVSCGSEATCTSFRRNHRDRCDVSVRQREYRKFLDSPSTHAQSAERVTKELNTVQIIDQIHTYFLHSFDCLYKLTKAEQDKLQLAIEEIAKKDRSADPEADDNGHSALDITESDDEDESIPDTTSFDSNISRSIRAYSDRLWRNEERSDPRRGSRFARTSKIHEKAKFCQIGRMLSRDQSSDPFTNSFVTHSCGQLTTGGASVTAQEQIDANEDEKALMSARDNGDKFGMENDIVYSFGVRFVYDKAGNNEYWYVRPKYDSLKAELLNNEFEPFSVEVWDENYERATDLMQTHHIKEHCKYVDRGNTVMSPSRRRESKRKRNSTVVANVPSMSISHLMAIMIYCGIDDLQAKFSESYRKFADEQDEDLKRRHSEWHQLGKYLREVVELYGTSIYSEESKLRRDHLKRLDLGTSGKMKFYHGINREMVFVSTTARICGPFSTSTQYPVALKFAGENGLLLQLTGNNASFFDCRYVSPYPAEEEKFFLGGYDPLIIETVFNPNPSARVGDYEPHVRAINIVASMFSGQQYHDKSDRAFSMRIKRLVLSLLRYKRTKKEEDDNVVPLDPYIQKLFAHYCCNTVDVVIDWNLMRLDQESHYPRIKGFKFVKNEICMASFQWIKMNRVVALFPNIKTLQINYVQLSHKTMQCILNTLQKKQNDGNYRSLEKIIIAQPVQKKMRVYDAISEYSRQFSSRINWILPVEDSNNYTDLVLVRLSSPCS